MLRIVLIRPGSTDYDVQERIQGSLDIPLNEQGLAEVAATVEQLRDKGIETIYAARVAAGRCKRPKSSPRRSASS